MHTRASTISRSLVLCIILSISVKYTSTANIFVWPLGDGVFNSEIKANANQGTIGDVNTAPGVPALNYSALAFNGMATSYVDLYVPASSSLTEDTTFLFYLYVEENTNGVLFRFLGSDTANVNDVLSDIDVTFNGLNVMFDFDGQSDSWAGGSDTLSVVLNEGAWNLIAFSRDYSNGNIEFYINGVSWSIDGGPKNIPLQLPGVIRIGYSQPSSVGLHGRISCFIIQDEKFNYNQLATAQTDCETSNWGITPVSCSPNCPSDRGFFELTDSGKTLMNFITRLDSASSFTSRRCADSCLANSKCVSFVIWKSTGNCELYSGNYTQFMQVNDSGDPKYYVRKA